MQRLGADHFLSMVPVGAEVEKLLPEVGKAAAEYSASLNPELRKIATPISVACKNCEYRAGRADARDGYRECWGTLADVKPHLLDLYHVGELGGRGGPATNELIARGKVGLFDVPKAKLVKTDGTVGARNRRQMTQIDYTRKGVEWMGAALPRILAGFKYPLRFIDFETTAIAVPYHAGMHNPEGRLAADHLRGRMHSHHHLAGFGPEGRSAFTTACVSQFTSRSGSLLALQDCL